MTTRSVSAPGKLILCGEYAVLRNAPAVVMAVDRRAAVRVAPGDAPWHVVTTPGFSDQAFRFDLEEGGQVAWRNRSPEPPPRIPTAVIGQVSLKADTPLRIEIDTRAFFSESGAKLGLGSSAAATVALTAALLARDTKNEDVWRTARKAHDALQGGSGADVAASCFGGLLIYRRDTSAAPDPVNWPDGLFQRVFFSGKAASTADAIDRATTADVSDMAWDSLSGAANNAADAWRAGNADAVLDAVRGYRDELRAFDRAGIKAIFSSGHDQLADVADDFGVVYKPSGAGGGDCGIGLAADIGQLDRFGEAASDRGFVSLDIQRDNNGV